MSSEKEAILTESIEALRGIQRDPEAPPAARASAARTLLEALGVVGARAERGSRLGASGPSAAARLSDAELSAAIARLAGDK